MTTLLFGTSIGPDLTKQYCFNGHAKDMHNILAAGWSPLSKRDLFKKVGLNSKTPRFEKILDFLKFEATGWMTMTNLENPNDPGQRYYTTQTGKDALAAYEPAATRPEPL